MKTIRHLTFWPAFICLLLTVYFTTVDKPGFIAATSALNNMVIANFAWLLNSGAVFLVGVCAYAYFSKAADIRIGGAEATPLLSPFKWFAVSLTAVIAMGILFWGAAEPVLHFREPPAFLGLEAGSSGAMQFAMSTMFVHWTITPYSIYTATALAFALAFHNLKMPFSIGSLLRPLLGRYVDGLGGQLIDALALFAVIIGMSATLNSGLLAIGDGFSYLMGIEKSPLLYAVIAIVIIGGTLMSAASGLHRGIQGLARINTWLYFVGLGFIFLVGPTAFILGLGTESLGVYLTHFFERNLVTGTAAQDQWAGWWTTAYFASWFGWAPVTCLFLGRIARGYTVRQFITVNLLLPSLFGFIWFSVISGSTLFFDLSSNGGLYQVYKDQGLASVTYSLFEHLPGSLVLSVLFIFACFITFITAADSNTDVIGALCTRGVSAENPRSPLWVKAVWGGAIAFVAWVSASYIGAEGIRMLMNLAGLPGALICIGAGFALLRILRGLTSPAPAPLSQAHSSLPVDDSQSPVAQPLLGNS
ncbi:BCCT family transporter [Pseudomonas paeninsulae]|uniref:BCCT family transporter n=1 Tax=Pseudomonas paeninsulae TaxID=3110772 RepID=UPI002D7A2E8A|nr:BCCT family transporter [Pseudomonas sp. IT1137]